MWRVNRRRAAWSALALVALLAAAGVEVRAQADGWLSRLDRVHVSLVADEGAARVANLADEAELARAALEMHGIAAAAEGPELRVRLRVSTVVGETCVFVANGELHDEIDQGVLWKGAAEATAPCGLYGGLQGLSGNVAAQLGRLAAQGRDVAVDDSVFNRAAGPSAQAARAPVAGGAVSRRPEVDYDSAFVLVNGAPIRQGHSVAEDVIATVAADEQLAIVKRPKAKELWINIVHVPSGTEGYVSRKMVDVVLARKAKTADLFIERDGNTRKAPELIIQNFYDTDMTFRFEGQRHVIPSGQSVSVSTLPGEKDYVVYAANAVPVIGRQKFRAGYRYELGYVVRR